MNQYTKNQVQDILKIIESSIVNCEKVRLKLKEETSSFSLNTNRIKALYISKALLKKEKNKYTKEEKVVIQITSIKNKSITGIGNAKEDSATHTRFSRLIIAMNIILDYLQNSIEEQNSNLKIIKQQLNNDKLLIESK